MTDNMNETFDFDKLADDMIQLGLEQSTSTNYQIQFDEVGRLAGKDEAWVIENIERIRDALVGHNDNELLEYPYDVKNEDNEKIIDLNYCSLEDDEMPLFRKENGRWIRKSDDEVALYHDVITMLSEIDELNVISDIKIYNPEDYGFEKDDKIHVLVEYEGETREDDLFNFLHENNEGEPLTIDGHEVDFNPINIEKSGTVEVYLSRLEKEKNADSYTNDILDKIKAAGIEVVTDKEEFERILNTEKSIQRMTGDIEKLKELQKSLEDKKLQEKEIGIAEQTQIQTEKELQEKYFEKFVNVAKEYQDYIPVGNFHDIYRGNSFYDIQKVQSISDNLMKTEKEGINIVKLLNVCLFRDISGDLHLGVYENNPYYNDVNSIYNLSKQNISLPAGQTHLASGARFSSVVLDEYKSYLDTFKRFALENDIANTFPAKIINRYENEIKSLETKNAVRISSLEKSQDNYNSYENRISGKSSEKNVFRYKGYTFLPVRYFKPGNEYETVKENLTWEDAIVRMPHTGTDYSINDFFAAADKNGNADIFYCVEKGKFFTLSETGIHSLNDGKRNKELYDSELEEFRSNNAELLSRLNKFEFNEEKDTLLMSNIAEVLELGEVFEKENETLGNVRIRKGTGINANGILHIAERRLEKKILHEHMDVQKAIEETSAILFCAINNIDKKPAVKETNGRWAVYDNGIKTAIDKDKKGYFVVTGFDLDETNQEAAETINAVNARYGYKPEFHEIYAQVGAANASLMERLTQQKTDVNEKFSSTIQKMDLTNSIKWNSIDYTMRSWIEKNGHYFERSDDLAPNYRLAIDTSFADLEKEYGNHIPENAYLSFSSEIELDNYLKDNYQFNIVDNNVYGFVHNSKIYLNPDLMNSNAAVHEYTHLWDAYTQKTNPELWDKGLELFKDTKYWNEVISDPNYQDIKDDENLVLSEIHSRICGDIAEKVLDRIAELDGEQTKLDAVDWNKETWNYISEVMMKKGNVTYEHGISSKDLQEFLTMPMKDLMEGKNINVENELRFKPIEDPADYVEQLMKEGNAEQLRDYEETFPELSENMNERIDNGEIFGRNDEFTPELKTYHILKKEDVENLQVISDEEFSDIVDSIIINDYKNIPNAVRLPNIKDELSEKLGLEKDSAFILKKSATHIRPDRKGGYGQAFDTEEYRMIPSVIRNADFAVVDNTFKNFQLIFDDKDDETKINKIIFNKDELGNYLVTIGKVDRESAFSEERNTVVAVGVAPTIQTLKERASSTALRASTTTVYSNIAQTNEKSTEFIKKNKSENSPENFLITKGVDKEEFFEKFNLVEESRKKIVYDYLEQKESMALNDLFDSAVMLPEDKSMTIGDMIDSIQNNERAEIDVGELAPDSLKDAVLKDNGPSQDSMEQERNGVTVENSTVDSDEFTTGETKVGEEQVEEDLARRIFEEFVAHSYEAGTDVPDFGLFNSSTGHMTVATGWQFKTMMDDNQTVVLEKLLKDRNGKLITNEGEPLTEKLEISRGEYEKIIENTGKFIKEPQLTEEVVREYEKVMNLDEKKQRPINAENFTHNVRAFCRSDANNPNEAIRFVQDMMREMKELDRKNGTNETEKVKEMMRQWEEKSGKNFAEKIIFDYNTATDDLKINSVSPFSSQTLRPIVENTEVISKEGALIDSRSNLKVGDSIKIKLAVEDCFGKKLHNPPMQNLIIVSHSPESNSIVLVDENRQSKYVLPRDTFIDKAVAVERKLDKQNARELKKQKARDEAETITM